MRDLRGIGLGLKPCPSLDLVAFEQYRVVAERRGLDRSLNTPKFF